MFKKYMFKQENIDAIDIAFAILDNFGKVRLLNKQCRDVMNDKSDVLIGRDWFELFSFNEKLEDVKRLFNRFLSGDLDALLLLQDIETKSLKNNLISWKFSLIRDENNTIEYLLCLGIDITTQKHIQESLYLESEEQSALNSILTLSLEDISLDKQLENVLKILLGLSWLPIASKGGIFLSDNKAKTLLLKAQVGLN